MTQNIDSVVHRKQQTTCIYEGGGLLIPRASGPCLDKCVVYMFALCGMCVEGGTSDYSPCSPSPSKHSHLFLLHTPPPPVTKTQSSRPAPGVSVQCQSDTRRCSSIITTDNIHFHISAQRRPLLTFLAHNVNR